MQILVCATPPVPRPEPRWEGAWQACAAGHHFTARYLPTNRNPPRRQLKSSQLCVTQCFSSAPKPPGPSHQARPPEETALGSLTAFTLLEGVPAGSRPSPSPGTPLVQPKATQDRPLANPTAAIPRPPSPSFRFRDLLSAPRRRRDVREGAGLKAEAPPLAAAGCAAMEGGVRLRAGAAGRGGRGGRLRHVRGAGRGSASATVGLRRGGEGNGREMEGLGPAVAVLPREAPARSLGSVLL